VQLAVHAGNRFIGLDEINWRDFPTENGLLSIPKAKKYGKILRCGPLLTGRIIQRQSDPSVHGTLFLWDTATGYLIHIIELQFTLSASSTFPTVETTEVDAKSYRLKWKGLSNQNLAVLALDVADVNGDGYNELILAEAKQIKTLRWNGGDFDKRTNLAEIQYQDDQSPITDRERRTMLSADQDGNDRDELYIGSPPDVTWRVEWLGDNRASVSKHSPMLIAHGADFFLAAKTATDSSNYEANSTVFLVRNAKGNQGTQPSALSVNYHSVAPRILNAISSDRSGEIVMVDSEGHLRAYRIDLQTARLLWQTPPLFGEGIAIGDLDGDAAFEIATSLSAPMEVQNGELRDQFVILENRHGLYTIVWKSPLLDGKIVDLKIDDADNDDSNEVVLCLRNRRGSQIRLYAATEYLD
ncbi:MAG: hypothetical protein OXT74_15155, partial [Candidatus Poribacteria bacterium]|nr:hypothetical protein [Candidatus Poribacteria bacterium]